MIEYTRATAAMLAWAFATPGLMEPGGEMAAELYGPVAPLPLRREFSTPRKLTCYAGRHRNT